MSTPKHSLSFTRLGLGVVCVVVLLLNACAPVPSSDEATATLPPEITVTLPPEATATLTPEESATPEATTTPLPTETVTPPVTATWPRATAIPLPPADVVYDGSDSITVFVGQTLAFPLPTRIAPDWLAMGYDEEILALLASPSDTPSSAGWLFQAIKPGKGKMVFAMFTPTCLTPIPTPGIPTPMCQAAAPPMPMKIITFIEVLPAP